MGSLPNVVPRLAGGSPRLKRIDRVGWTVGACFESHGVRVGVRSNHAALLGQLPELLPPGSRRTGGPAVDQLFSLWVPCAPRPRPTRVYAGAERRVRAWELGDALAVLESEMRHAVAAQARGRTFVHAGVVGWRGRAIVVPGRSRSGKTTLVAELVRAGAAYLSDEFAVLDPRGRAHPFAKRLSIRGPGGCDRHAQRPSAEELGGRSGRAALPVGMVVVTEHRSGAAWRPQSLTAGRGVLEMLAHTVAARLRPETSLASLERAVEGAIILKGARGEAADLAPRLLAAAERAWGSVGLRNRRGTT